MVPVGAVVATVRCRVSCGLVVLAVGCGTSSATPDAGRDVARDTAVDASADVIEDRIPGLIELPDEHVACAARNPRRNPYFGDLHVHTKLSFDAITYDVRGGPEEAYAFAQGAEVGLPPYGADGAPSRRLRLARPLDFAAVTDHAEYLAETTICHDPTSPAYDSTTCAAYREAQGLVSTFSLALGGLGARPQVCAPGDEATCRGTADRVWQRIQDAAEAAYDRSAACRFTTFVGYEWSGSPGGTNAHRNVIFRGRTVPRVPISYFDAPTPAQLWRWLDAACVDAGRGCDVLTIPHNGNVSGGGMFNPITDHGPLTRDEAAQRARLEPLVEVYQHKGASECLRSSGNPLASEDERCDFEQLLAPACPPGSTAPTCTPLCAPGALGALTGLCEHPSDFARGALRNGLLVWQRTGVNPFHFGLVASTDTHAAIPGATDEGTWPGHTGTADSDPADRLRPHERGQPAVTVASSGPGGLAVLWAEENTRGALFEAMRRREAYATSGTRLVVRLFAGWNLPDDLCARTDAVEVADAQGVPMGADLPARPAGAGAPVLYLSALRDVMGAGLDRIQIVKGWVEGGETRERVWDLRVRDGRGVVDTATCATRDGGPDAMCGVWRDPAFDPAAPAFYYARVLEDPTCRWSRRVCNALRVDCASVSATSPLRACCDGRLPDTVQERAWTSPIWYLPAR